MAKVLATDKCVHSNPPDSYNLVVSKRNRS